MLPRDIPRLYDNISDPPPSAEAFYYAQSIGYYTQARTANIDIRAMDKVAFMRHVSEYCPSVYVAMRRYKPYESGGQSAITSAENCHYEWFFGARGVCLAAPTLPDGSLGNQCCAFTANIGNSVISETAMWSANKTVWYTNNNTIREQQAVGLGGNSGTPIIVGVDLSKYIWVPYITAINDSSESQYYSYADYKNHMTEYPYIQQIELKPYYKSNIASNNQGVDSRLRWCHTGYSVTNAYFGESSNNYNSNWSNVADYECNYEGMFQNRIFTVPAISGRTVTLGALPMPSYLARRSSDSSSYLFRATHSNRIYKYKDLTPNDSNNYNTIAYIDFDTATKIINSIGFMWAESLGDTVDYHGENTTSDKIYMPQIGLDGSTSPNAWNGEDIYNNWNNSNYMNIHNGDVINGNYNMNAPVDYTNQTNTTIINYNTTELQPTTPLLNGLGVFANYYTMTNTNVLALSDFLWNADESIINDVINSLKLFGQNPMNAIMSLRLYPFNVYDLLPSHTIEHVVLGRVDTEVNAIKIPNDSSTVLDLGTLFVKPKFNDFRDYAPYTSYNLYIPFIGTVTLNANDYLNHVIGIKMIADITTGKATAILYADGIPMQYLDGMLGVEIPLTSSNMSETVASIINAVGYTAAAVGSAVSGNYIGAATSLASGVADVLFNDVSINKQGNVSPAAALSQPINAYLIISRPSAVIPNNYGHAHGYACDYSATVGNLNGFTRCYNVDVSGISATDREKTEIKALLEGGIYL